MNKETFLINESLLKKAQKLCTEVADPNISNRAIADIFASELAHEYFSDIDVDIESGLHNIPAVLDDIDISDIYIQNTYIDVRLYFDDNELCIPASHFERNILPVAYMFIKIDKELVNAKVIGFITPGNINITKSINGYYPVNEQDLLSFYDIEQLLNVSYADEVTDEVKKQIYSYFDDNCEDKDNLYKELVNSKEARIIFAKAYSAQKASKELAKDSDFISSISTDLIGDDIENTTSELLSETNDDFELESAISDYENSELTLDSDDQNELDSGYDNDELLDNSDEPDDIIPLISDDDNLMSELSENIDSQASDIAINSDDNAYDFEELSDDILISDDTQEENATLENISENSELTSLEEQNTDNFSDDTESGIEATTENIVNLPEEFDEQKLDEVITETPESPSNDIDDFVNGISEAETEEKSNIDEFYNTSTTPSLDTIDTNYNTSDVSEKSVENGDIKQIDNLYPQEETTNDEVTEEIEFNQNAEIKKKNRPNIINVLVLAVIIGAGVYFGYNKYNENSFSPPPITEEKTNKEVTDINNNETAMPDESLENTAVDKSKDEGNSVAIPSIENHLDTTILVSNLSVTWEVPSGYVSNSGAQRYFTTIGKIVQLKLKTELLLINRPPINNKIALELKFNPDKQYFEIKDIISSSGEKVIDDTVRNTVRSVLESNINSNISSFGNIQGNPVLVISL